MSRMRTSIETCACGAVFEFWRVSVPPKRLKDLGWDLALTVQPQPHERGWAVDPHDELEDWEDFLVCPDCLAKRKQR